MADIGRIEEAIRQIAPPHLAEEWDNCGFQIRCSADQQIPKDPRKSRSLRRTRHRGDFRRS